MNINKLFKRAVSGNRTAIKYIMSHKNMRRYAVELDHEDGRFSCLYVHGFAAGDKAIVWTEIIFKENGKVTGNCETESFRLINKRDFEDAVDDYAELFFTVIAMAGRPDFVSDITECPFCNAWASGGVHHG